MQKGGKRYINLQLEYEKAKVPNTNSKTTRKIRESSVGSHKSVICNRTKSKLLQLINSSYMLQKQAQIVL